MMLIPNSKQGPSTIMIIDPQNRTGKIAVPSEKVEPTLGKRQYIATALGQDLDVPRDKDDFSLCMLYQNGKCNAGRKCRQIHVSAEFITYLRIQARHTSNCCAAHGDIRSQEDGFQHQLSKIKPEFTLVMQGGVRHPLPITYLARTQALESQISRSKKKLVVQDTKLCLLHLQDRCRYGCDCRRHHLCRAVWQQVERSLTPLATPIVVPGAAFGPQQNRLGGVIVPTSAPTTVGTPPTAPAPAFFYPATTTPPTQPQAVVLQPTGIPQYIPAGIAPVGMQLGGIMAGMGPATTIDGNNLGGIMAVPPISLVPMDCPMDSHQPQQHVVNGVSNRKKNVNQMQFRRTYDDSSDEETHHPSSPDTGIEQSTTPSQQTALGTFGVTSDSSNSNSVEAEAEAEKLLLDDEAIEQRLNLPLNAETPTTATAAWSPQTWGGPGLFSSSHNSPESSQTSITSWQAWGAPASNSDSSVVSDRFHSSPSPPTVGSPLGPDHSPQVYPSTADAELSTSQPLINRENGTTPSPPSLQESIQDSPTQPVVQEDWPSNISDPATPVHFTAVPE
eukprot:TRINITY_DN32591_c0_g1_i1.p1 TRINITY_DN32591_c0_g1~~TRINITY_DN32591_c0_g1_i1.p1  ORF type:complete len:559 (+),score=45.88 TRINITY_DN32591_c0_g1_i1:39-1715(+)